MSEKQEQQNTERSRMLGTMEMRKLVPTVSVPIMVSMLVQALYNIVDGIFVGQYLPDALTAVNLAMPMQMLMIAVSTGMGTGINSLISRRLGEKRPHDARDAARHGILIEVVGWLLFVIVGLFFARMYIGMTNPKAEVLEMGTLYLRIVCTLSLGQFMSICFERMMQATGNTTLSMITQLSGAVTNIILDPILIFSCQMGIAGAAIATVIGQVVSCTVGFVLNQWKNRELRLTHEDFILCGSSSVGRAPPCQGGGRGSEPRLPLHFLLWCHSQVVRQRSAKPSFSSSNLDGTSQRAD